MVEYPQHLNAKARLKEILKTAGYENISFEVQQPTIMLQSLGERRYVADIQAEREGQIYIFEIDGVKGHSTRRNRTKDKTRDGALFILNRRTIRLLTWWIVGKGKLTDREILDEIEWQISIMPKTTGAVNVVSQSQKYIGDVLNVAALPE